MPKDIFSIGEQPDKKMAYHSRRAEWVEDSYISEPPAENYLSSHFDQKRLRFAFIIIAVVLLGILGRVGYLQVARGSEYRSAAEENRIRIQDIKAPRGIIYDRNGTILARNVPNFVLLCTPADLPKDLGQRTLIIDKIAQILKTDPKNIQDSIAKLKPKSYQSYTIQDHIPYDQAMLLKIASVDLPGISLETENFREYIGDTTLAHLLGYMGKLSLDELAIHPDYSHDDYIGKGGVELSYENILKGTNGKKEIEVNSFGKESKVVTESKAVAGQDITLTIDKNLESILGTALDKIVAQSKSIGGAAAVALDPRNGEVLALVSSPTFDSNALTRGLTSQEYSELSTNPKKPFLNRSVAAEYPSGSTIKPVIAAAALAEKIITPATTFLSSGGIRIGQWFFPDWKAGGHGVTDVRRALAESINTFFYIVGGGFEKFAGLGVERMTTYFKLFGLGDKLGIDVPNEATGFLPSIAWKEKTKGESWYIGDTYHLSIGQGDLLVTPLQVASYTSTIANGGTFHKPHVVKTISNPADSQQTTTVQPTIIRQNFIDEADLQVVREGLRQAVTSGSARALSNLPFTVAAKTGTAQFGSEGKTHAWFTAFAPYEDPQIVITVIIEGGGEGSATALPIARDGLTYWFSQK